MTNRSALRGGVDFETFSTYINYARSWNGKRMRRKPQNKNQNRDLFPPVISKIVLEQILYTYTSACACSGNYAISFFSVIYYIDK